MNQYNAIDLFCGAGGLSYGFECAGFNILLGIDSDQKALEVFERNHKGAKSICGDITNINYSDIREKIGNKKIDIIIGGPPCQGMSLSGPREFDDPRNKLYLSYIRLVDEIRPRAFVIENVPGLVSLFGGQIKDSIIEKFTEMGYKVKYQILCAADYGVPQNRKRVVFVGTREKNEFFYPSKSDEQVTCKMALWSFVMNDELWNLMPMDSSLNSSKSNHLPKWNPFFKDFAYNQYILYGMIHENENIHKRFEACYRDNLHSIWAGQELYRKGNTEEEFYNILEKNMLPVYESARRQGYEVWEC